jgi:hypothetical protein
MPACPHTMELDASETTAVFVLEKVSASPLAPCPVTKAPASSYHKLVLRVIHVAFG